MHCWQKWWQQSSRAVGGLARLRLRADPGQIEVKVFIRDNIAGQELCSCSPNGTSKFFAQVVQQRDDFLACACCHLLFYRNMNALVQLHLLWQAQGFSVLCKAALTRTGTKWYFLAARALNAAGKQSA